MRTRFLPVLLGCIVGVVRPAAAQRLVDRAPAALHRAAAVSLPPSQALSARVTWSGRPKRWPWFALGGAVLGGAGSASFMIRHCDAGCRDDGGFEMLPYIALGGAAAGAILGSVVGLAFDAAHRS